MYKNRAVALAAARFAYRQTVRFQRDFIWVVGVCYLCVLVRGLQNLEAPFGKGFNFVSAKLPLRRAESRFAEPRTSRKGTVLFFSLVRKEPKVPQRFANLWTPGTIQISARFVILAENDRHSSSNRPRRELQAYRVSPVRI